MTLRAAVFSDTHGNTELMKDAIRRCRPDVIIHLGDHDRDAVSLRTEFPSSALYSVCGNCDLMPLSPDRDTVQLGPVRAFITHGHLYNVSPYQQDSLVYAALEQGAKIAMFGHTHRAMCNEVGSVTVLNPGTAGKGRLLTWALVTVFDNGAFSCEIQSL